MSDADAGRPLRRSERRLLVVLGLPALGMAFSTTIVSTYLPVVAHALDSSTTVIGVIIGGEGLMALWVPLVAGSWSDRFSAKGGSRLGFLVSGAPIVAATLAVMGLVGSLVTMGIVVALFFAASFYSYEPYRALYPDLAAPEIAARAQGVQALWRGGGTFLALVSGGLLLSLTRFLPFVTAAVLDTGSIALLLFLLPRIHVGARGRPHPPSRSTLQEALHAVTHDVRVLLRDHCELRDYLVANCLWELSLGALKSFIVLYVTIGLGRSLASTSLIVGAVALIILVGAFASGKVADRLGTLRTMRHGLWLYGLALLVPIFTTSPVVLIVAAAFIAFGGGLTMTLPYALLQPLMPEDKHGLLTAFYSFSRGLGVMLGPLLAGVAISAVGSGFSSTHGYAAMWIPTSAAILLSLPVVRRLRAHLARAEGTDYEQRPLRELPVHVMTIMRDAGGSVAHAAVTRSARAGTAAGCVAHRVAEDARRAWASVWDTLWIESHELVDLAETETRQPWRRLVRRLGGRRRTKVVVLFACVLGLHTADLASMGAMASQLEGSLHIQNTQFGLLAAVPSLAAAATTLPFGMLADRISRVRLLSVGVMTWAVAMVASGAIGSYTELLLVRIALGGVAAISGPAIASLTGDLFKPNERGRIYGYILVGELLGSGFGYLLCGNIAAALNWRFGFWVLVIPAVVLSVALRRMLTEPARGGAGQLEPTLGPGLKEEGRDPTVAEVVRSENIPPREDVVVDGGPSRDMPLWAAVRYVLRVRTNVALIVSGSLGYFFAAGVEVFGALYVHDHFGVATGASSSLLVVIGIGALAGVLIGGRLADGLLHRRHITGRLIVGGVGYLLAAAIFVPGLLVSSLGVGIALYIVAAAALSAPNPALDAARLDVIPSWLWGRAEAVRTVLRTLLVAAAPLVFGFVSEQLAPAGHRTHTSAGHYAASGPGLKYAFLLMLVPMAISGVVLLWARRTYPREVAAALASQRRAEHRHSDYRGPQRQLSTAHSGQSEMHRIPERS